MGKRRHLSRRLALQILFAREFLREPPAAIVKRLEQTGEVTSKNWTPFCEDLLTHTISQLADLDTTISEVLENWRIERLSKVDRV
ncbi:hypothetical protein HQ520_12625, partial [bacterium]|nr:hypothetical protein [bacterium]